MSTFSNKIKGSVKKATDGIDISIPLQSKSAEASREGTSSSLELESQKRDLERREHRLRGELAEKDREILELRSRSHSAPIKEEMKMVSLQLPSDFFEIFKEEVLSAVGTIYNPNRLGHHKASHNQFIRALFVEMMVRLDLMDLDEVNDEEGIKREVSKLFKEMREH